MKITRINSLNYNNKNQKINQRPTFGRVWEEHVSWGANYIKETGKTNFKLFSFPDAKAVFVEVAQKGKAGLDKLWERTVAVLGTAGLGLVINDIKPQDKNSKIYRMDSQGDGVYTAKNIDAKIDDNYRFIVVDKNNNINMVKDPYSKKQNNVLGWSTIYNPNNYEWQNKNWLEGKDSRRIVRKPDENFRGLEKLIIDEINIPTLSKEGSFEDAKKRIDVIADREIATAIELLPVENTYSLQWGYDGVDKLAVNEKMGGAAKLKELIDYAHGKGLNVIMDMVPNHIGPDGNFLGKTGPYIKGAEEFGDAFNYEGQNNKYVRDLMVNAALWWANEFKVDGIRLDMTKYCGSDYLLKQIAIELNEHNPNVFIIAEDGRDNKESVTRYETRHPDHEKDLKFIDTQVDFIADGYYKSTPVNIGFDSEWDFKFMTTIKNAIINSGSNLLDDLDDKIRNSQHRVKYVMSHDEIGNWDGTRMIPKFFNKNLGLIYNIDGHSDAEKGQKSAHLAQKLAKITLLEDFSKMSDDELFELEKQAGLKNYIDKTTLNNTMKTALAKQKLLQGVVMTIPGPKMYFQGDDEADLSYFKFFREFSDEKQGRVNDPDVKNRIINAKGYDTLEELARPDCIVGQTKFGGEFKNAKQQMIDFNHDLSQLVQNNNALLKGDIVATHKNYNGNIHTHHLKYGNEEVLVIKNFGEGFYNQEYGYYGFPENSTWIEIFNSDDKKYGGSNFNNAKRNDINNMNQNLSLAANSFIILKKV